MPKAKSKAVKLIQKANKRKPGEGSLAHLLDDSDAIIEKYVQEPVNLSKLYDSSD